MSEVGGLAASPTLVSRELNDEAFDSFMEVLDVMLMTKRKTTGLKLQSLLHFKARPVPVLRRVESASDFPFS